MPQTDRHRERIVPIEFEAHEEFISLPQPERVTLALISYGKSSFLLNGRATALSAPSILLLSQYDKLEKLLPGGSTSKESPRIAAKSFSFKPVFINSSLTFERLKANDFDQMEDEHDRNLMDLFLKRDDYYEGYIDLPPQTYLRISEWLAIIGTETYAQSDGMWTCRIRRYLLQTLYLLEDIYLKRKEPNTIKREKSPVDILLEYIHTNYANEITLDLLCRVANLNRTSLNRKFKTQTGHTAIDYVLSHRLKIACEALRHTNLTLGEIAEAIGFQYDTYFIRQFTNRMGVSPTEYRLRYWG